MRYDEYFKIEPALLKDSQARSPLIDVRTPAEYAEGHVPGSINIPIFSEEEREKISRVYRETPRAARFVAMELIGPKLSRFIRRIHQLTRGKNYPVIVTCWRGGMRSKATVDLLRMAGVEALQLNGGYRNYRKYIKDCLDNFQLTVPVVVLKGKSGTGKTEIILHLQGMDKPAIDLEGLAGHRGSAFGGYAAFQSKTQKNFDALLLQALEGVNEAKWLVLEGESKRIGNLYLPDFLYNAMKSAHVIEAESALEARIDRTLKDYTPQTQADLDYLQRALNRIQTKLSQDNYAKLNSYLGNKQYREFATLLLTQYYDNIYDYQLPGRELLFTINSEDTKRAATKVAALLEQRFIYSAGKTSPAL